MEPRDTERLIRHLKLGELRAISEIARNGSLLAAAAALGTTQPALTRALAAAEATLGVRLFERLPRGVRPTLFGQALLRRIASIFSEIRGAADDIASLNGLSRGTISVGAVPLAAAGLLPESLQRLVAGRPGLRAEVLEGNPEILLNELRARRIEIIVGRVPPLERDRDLHWEVLYEEDLSVIVNHRHRLHRRRGLRLRDLLDEPWILPPPATAFYTQVVALFEGAGAEIPAHQIRTLSVPLNLGMILRTNFLTVLPSSLITLGSLPQGVRPLAVTLPPTRGPVGFIRLAGAGETPALREFMACTRAVAAEIAARRAGRGASSAA